ncbi:MAG: hypothetical protein HY618_07625 [Candidatus Tectomicrobia bacterium]|uniref:Uncharacterized protein n=1 Tax=Tectimicrobiota bacterium TaxID=2528274 RepID=A0A932ZV33_UNCTE|nr:hypothetical protein [Candidatus Tectomicrobia bacterium]
MTAAQATAALAAWNMEFVGYHGLEDRPAFKIAMREKNGRFYLYLSCFWTSGWSVLDVTDPESPRYLRFVPGPDNTWTLQVQVADGLLVTSLEKIPAGWGPRPDDPPEKEGVFIWDVETDPASPRLLSHWATGAQGTHRNFYSGGRYAHLSAYCPGYDGNIYRVLDLQDPSKPREAGRWWLPEQERGGSGVTHGGGESRRVFNHGPAHAEGGRAYVPYAAGGMVILNIEDISSPKFVSRLNVHPPLGSTLAMHTVYPFLKRGVAIANSEALKENCDEPLNYAAVIDIRDEKSPRIMSLFPVPDPPPGYSHKNFCERGGRFGPHNQHHPQGLACLEQRDDRIYLTYFNAGLRVYDLQDPIRPREIAHYVPADPARRLGMLPQTLVTQSEDVLVDRRGFIYVTDKNHGLHVLRCTA